MFFCIWHGVLVSGKKTVSLCPGCNRGRRPTTGHTGDPLVLSLFGDYIDFKLIVRVVSADHDDAGLGKSSSIMIAVQSSTASGLAVVLSESLFGDYRDVRVNSGSIVRVVSPAADDQVRWG